MSPAARRTLSEMVKAFDLSARTPDRRTIEALAKQAERHLGTAQCGINGDDPEGAFTVAYDSCRKTCLALVSATGFAPGGDSEHMSTFEAAAEIADHFGQRPLVDEAADLRQIRHGAQYRGESITIAEAQEALDVATELHAKLSPQIAKALTASGV